MSFFGRSATRRAFRYIFARLNFPATKISPKSHFPSPNPNSHYLAKDAAPIPNALGTSKLRILASKPVAEPVEAPHNKSQLTIDASWLLQYKQNKKGEPFDSPEIYLE